MSILALTFLLVQLRWIAWLHRMSAILSEAILGLLSESDPTPPYRSCDAATQPCEVPSPRRARRRGKSARGRHRLGAQSAILFRSGRLRDWPRSIRSEEHTSELQSLMRIS